MIIKVKHEGSIGNVLPDQKRLKELLDYNPETGLMIWKPRGCSWFDPKYAGKVAFNCDHLGYKAGCVAGVSSFAHRVAFKMVHGIEPAEVDHINGVRSDNRISNLRAVNSTANKRNSAKPRHNTSGVVGVRYREDKRKWCASITLDNKQKHIGYFGTLEEAAKARKDFAKAHGFHENHGRPQW